MLQSSQAVSCQNAVTLFSQRIVVHGVPLRQLTGVAPRHQCVFQHSVPLFVPQENLAPLLTRNLRGRIRRYGLGWHNETLSFIGVTLWTVFNTSVRKIPFMIKNKAQLEKNSKGGAERANNDSLKTKIKPHSCSLSKSSGFQNSAVIYTNMPQHHWYSP